jgi:hypothetical protein
MPGRREKYALLGLAVPEAARPLIYGESEAMQCAFNRVALSKG